MFIKTIRNTLLIIIVLVFNGCSTNFSIIAKPTNIYKQVNVGDEVTIDTKNGKHYSFTVTEVTPTHIVGSSNKVSTQNIDSLSLKEIDLHETAYALYGVAVAAAVLFFIN